MFVGSRLFVQAKLAGNGMDVPSAGFILMAAKLASLMIKL